jgi:DNA-directed RNA polymerase specialized sigma24 family protein
VTTRRDFDCQSDLPQNERERKLIAALYPALRRIAAVAGSVDIEPDDLVQEALMRVLRTSRMD